MTSDECSNGTEQDSIWADCAECESGDTEIGFVDDPNPIICNDCGAETRGINKLGDADWWDVDAGTERDSQ